MTLSSNLVPALLALLCLRPIECFCPTTCGISPINAAASSVAKGRIEMLETPSPLHRIASADELEAIEPSDGYQWVFIARQGCKYSCRMVKSFADRCEADSSAGVDGYVLELAADDDATAEALGVTLTPKVIVFRQGEREFDFVAQSPSALHYGLQDLGRLVEARDQPPERQQ